jgi:hypothetical protein
MSDRRHYERLSARPEKESMYAFLLTSVAINDVEPKPALWLGPTEITQDMAAVVRAYYERVNPISVAIEGGFRKQAMETLRLMPEASLNAPLDSDVEVAVQSITNGYRLELKCLEERSTADVLKRGTPFDDEGLFSRELCARVITATNDALGVPGYEATASYLNEGLPRGKNRMGLDRHHIRRAYDGRNKMWERIIRATARSPLGSPVSSIVTLTLADRATVSALDIVYAQARQHPKFSKHQGEDLAWAIHEDFDLNERIHRADSWLRAKRIAAV